MENNKNIFQKIQEGFLGMKQFEANLKKKVEDQKKILKDIKNKNKNK